MQLSGSIVEQVVRFVNNQSLAGGATLSSPVIGGLSEGWTQVWAEVKQISGADSTLQIELRQVSYDSDTSTAAPAASGTTTARLGFSCGLLDVVSWKIRVDAKNTGATAVNVNAYYRRRVKV